MTLEVTLKDGFGIPVMGQPITFSVSPSGPSLTQPTAVTNSYGIAQGSLVSSVAGTFTLSAQTPGGFNLSKTVTLTAAAISPTYSSISGSATTVADGVATATITISLRDPSNVPVSGVIPSFSATDTGGQNSYGACSLSDGAGLSTCTLKSTKAENKTLSISAPITKVGDAISFVHGAVVLNKSTLAVTPGALTANGTSQAQIVLTARDQHENPVPGISVTFAATGTGNTLGQPGSATDAAGVAQGTLSSTVAESKTISLVGAPGALASLSASVVFNPGAASGAQSSIATSPGSLVVSNGSSQSTVQVTLRDAFGNLLRNTGLTLQVSGTSNTLSGSQLTTDSNGVASATLSSTQAELKTLSVSGISGLSGSVTFVAGAASSTTSTLSSSPSSGVPADLASSSLLTATLKDAFGNPLVGQTVVASVSGGTGNQLSSIPSTNASGITTFTLASSSTGTKTVGLTTPSGLGALSATVAFVTPSIPINPPDPAQSSIQLSASSGIVADGVATTTVTVTLRDASGNPVVNQGLTLSVSGTSNSLGAVSGSTNASGQWSTTLASTKAETKTISISAPSGLGSLSASATFVAGPPSSATSNFVASPSSGIVADGSSSATVTLTLKDAQGNPAPSVAVSLASSGGVLGSASGTTNGSGVFATTLTSTSSGSKTVSISTPSSFGTLTASVAFVAGPIDASQSSLTVSTNGPVTANGSSSVTLTALLRDAHQNPLVGQSVVFAATGTGNTLTQPGSGTDATGTATGTLRSTVAQSKSITITTPSGLAIPALTQSLNFVPGPASAATSTLVASRTSGVLADGVDSSTITVTLKDAQGNVISGQAVTLSAGGTGNTFTQGAASTDGAGQLSATLASTSSGTKSVSITSPAGLETLSSSVAFTCSGADDTNSTLSTSVSTVTADGVSSTTVTVTVRDASDTPNVCAGLPVSIDVSGSGNTVSPVSGTTDASGVFTATVKSTVAEGKVIGISNPSGLGASADVLFVAGAASSLTSTISAFPSTGISSSTGGVVRASVQIALKDAQGNAISGASPLFTSTGSNNFFTQPGTTSVSGAASGSIGTTTAETKTLSITNPTGLTSVSTSVTFIVSNVDASRSSIAASPTTLQVGGTSTITLTLRNAANAPLAGETPVIQVTNSGGDNSSTSCSLSNASGVSTCTVSSRTAEVKSVQMIAPVNLSGPTIRFTRDLEVPIEFLDTGIQALSGNTDWLVSQTSINLSAYDGALSYSFEGVCSNTGTANVSVSLMHGPSSTAASFSVTAGTSALTRFATTSVTLPTGTNTFRVRTGGVSSGVVQCSAVRLVIRQVGATKTRIYVPLTGRSATNFATTAPTGVPATSAGYIATISSTTYGQPTGSVQNFNWFELDPNYWSVVSGVDLAAIVSSQIHNRQARVRLVAGTSKTQVAVASATGTGLTLLGVAGTLPSTSLPTLYQVVFSSNKGNVAAYLYRAGMWITLSALKKGEICYRVGRAETVTASSGTPTVFDALRIPINLADITSSTFYTQLVGAATSGSGTLEFLSGGVNASGTAGSVVDSETWNGAKAIRTSASSVAFTDSDQLFTRAFQSSGSGVSLSSACGLVRFD
jgi:adhesin/invasin